MLSLTDQGFVFPGSDDARHPHHPHPRVRIDHGHPRRASTGPSTERHIAQVGAAVDASVLPASPFNNDGGNGADFNNYVFAYYSDSGIYLNAMRQAGVQAVASARIDMDDETVDECVLDRTVTVRPDHAQDNYGFTANGIVPDAACEPAVVPFIGNWWSVR